MSFSKRGSTRPFMRTDVMLLRKEAWTSFSVVEHVVLFPSFSLYRHVCICVYCMLYMHVCTCTCARVQYAQLHAHIHMRIYTSAYLRRQIYMAAQREHVCVSTSSGRGGGSPACSLDPWCSGSDARHALGTCGMRHLYLEPNLRFHPQAVKLSASKCDRN